MGKYSTPSSPSTPAKHENGISVPTILLIWQQFIEDGHAYSDAVASEDLCALWTRVISGQKLPVETQKMSRCLAHVAPYVAPTCAPHVGGAGIDRWLHSLLCCCAGSDARAAVRCLQGLLEGNLRSSHAHHSLQEALLEACSGRGGRRRIADLLETCCFSILPSRKQLSERTPLDSLGKPSDRGMLRHVAFSISQAIEALGLTGDELITYPQLLALCFGRFEVPVTLHFYDLSRGHAQVWSNFEGIWHTAIVVFGREYFYNGRPVFDKPGESDFGKVTKVLHLGWTFHKQDELHSFVVGEMASRYTIETYEALANNCNHFSDEILTFLLGQHLPDEVLRQEENILQIPGMRLLWPAFTQLVNSCNIDSQKHTSLICDTKGTAVSSLADELQRDFVEEV